MAWLDVSASIEHRGASESNKIIIDILDGVVIYALVMIISNVPLRRLPAFCTVCWCWDFLKVKQDPKHTTEDLLHNHAIAPLGHPNTSALWYCREYMKKKGY